MLKHLRIAAIGPATKKAIVKHGLKVKMVPEEYVAESVVKGLRDQVNGKRVALIRAKVARDVIPEELRAAGARSRCGRSLRNRRARKIAASGCAL
jgi:uroporphyrinogen-III synthase